MSAAHISEFNAYSANGGDFVELSLPKGTDPSGFEVYAYNFDGTIKGGPFSLGSVVSTMGGRDVYVIEETDGISISFDSAIALVEDGTVTQFITADSGSGTAVEGPANGTNPTQVGVSGGNAFQSDDGGQTYYQQPNSNRGTVPCFAAGTQIETPNGAVAVEDLRVGDLVLTLDHGAQPIIWTQSRQQSLVGRDAAQMPVVLKQGCFGHMRPVRDTTLSPQHRILVGEAGQLTAIFRQSGLAPAKGLVGLPGITQAPRRGHVSWHHFALKQHAVVFANGLAAESLLFGAMVLKGLTPPQRVRLRDEVASVLSAETCVNGPLARPALRVRQTQARINGLALV